MNINNILEQGEGQYIEFKENLDKSLASEIVSFANASGGKIFLGISDNRVIKGISITNKLKSQIQDIARNCDPEILITFEEYDDVLIINVNEGVNKPYSCSSGFYMRINANSQKMKRDEILQLAIKGGKIRFDEQICTYFDWNDFDDEKFQYYLKLAKISYNLDRDELLRNLKVLTDEGFTNAGVLFFAKNPYKYFFTSKVRCVHFNDNNRVNILDKKEVDRGIIGNIEFAINYLKELIPVRYKIEKLAREEFPEYSEKAYREVIVNAIIHFDYFEGSSIAIEKLKSYIIVNNKGELLFDKKEFGSRSELRNRLLADLLSRTEYMERLGTGIKRIRDACLENGNQVEFDFTDSFWAKIYSNVDVSGKVTEKVTEKVTDKVTDNQYKILIEIKKNQNITTIQLSEIIDISQRKIKDNIAKLKQKGYLIRIGPAKGGYWKILK